MEAEYQPPNQVTALLRDSLRATYMGSSSQEVVSAQQVLTSNITRPQFQEALLSLITCQPDRQLQAAAISFLKVQFSRDCLSTMRVFTLPKLSGKLAKNIARSLQPQVKQMADELKWVLLDRMFGDETWQPLVLTNMMALAGILIGSVECERENIERIAQKYLTKVIAFGEVVANRIETILTSSESTPSQQDALTSELFGLQNLMQVAEAFICLSSEDGDLELYVTDGLCSNLQFSRLVARILLLPNGGSSGLLIVNPQCESACEMNNLKSAVLHISHTVHQRPLEEIFEAIYQTFLLNSARSARTIEETTLLADVISSIERYSLDKRLNNFFCERKLEVTMACMQYCVADSFELQMAMDNPATFVELASDFCDSQDLESPKTRVASLIASLCHGIDGFLSYFVEVLLKLSRKACDELQPYNCAPPEFYLKPFRINPTSELLLDGLVNYPYSKLPPLSIVESSLLVLASISDQLERRNDVLEAALECVLSMPIHRFDDIAATRYVLLSSFLSHRGLLSLMVETCCRGNISKVLEEQIYDSIARLLNRFRHKQESTEEGKLIRSISRQLMQRLPCWSRAYQLVVERKTWCSGDLNLVRTLLRLAAQQLEELLKDDLKLERACVCMCYLIEQLTGKDLAKLQPQLRMIADGLIHTSSRNSYFVNLVVNWLDCCKQLTPQTEEIVVRLLQTNYHAELVNRFLYYRGEISPEEPAFFVILPQLLQKIEASKEGQEVFEAAALLQLVVLRLAAPHPELLRIAQESIKKYQRVAQLPLVFPKINNVLMAIYYRFPRDAEQVLGGIYWSLRASFIHRAVLQAVQLLSRRSVKVYVVYMMHLAVLQGTVLNSNPEEMLAEVVAQMGLLGETLWNARQYEGTINGRSEILLKEEALKHPFDSIDELELFQQAWEKLTDRVPQLKESKLLHKTKILQLLQQRKVGNHSRTIVKIKRS